MEAASQLLGPVATDALGREQPLPAALALARRPEPTAVLTRTFVLGLPATRRQLDDALPACRAAGAEALGLVTSSGPGREDEVRALLDLRPYAAVDAAGTSEWWLVSDLDEVATGRPLRHDHVLGVGGASTMLAQVTVRRPVARALDIGTGCGIQALHASRHAGHATATDVSPRALGLAGLNLALAGVTESVDLRQGNLLKPVRGELFDLVVSNPPFVVTPRRPDVALYSYRDGGLTGDRLVRDLVTSVGQVLAPGGTAQLLASWEVREGASWQDRVDTWVQDSGLDGWAVQRELQDPAQYAETWIRDGGVHCGPEFDRLYEAWLTDFAARSVTALGFGLVVLHKPWDESRARWRRLEEQYGPVRQPLGEHISRCLDARDRLAGLDDAALLDTRWTVAADVTEERHYRPGDEDPSVILLRQGGGFGRSVQVGTVVAGAVGACDGELSVGQIAAALAALLGEPDGAVREQLLPAVRGLAGDALLVPL
ncbi:MAG: methyltransferase [Actinomycetes bacterium]